MDDLPFGEPLTGPNGGAAPPRKHRHRWVRHETHVNVAGEAAAPVISTACVSCNAIWDEATSRRGRTNRSRGNAIERTVARVVGGRRTGQFGGKDDVLVDGLFAFQVKSQAAARWPSWMARELDALRAHRTDREPVLVVAEAPGPGRKSRRLYVVDETTWLAIHGPEVER